MTQIDLLGAIQETLKDTTDNGLIQLDENARDLLKLVKMLKPKKFPEAEKVYKILKACIDAERQRRAAV